jgi:two-component sensor histidine kinase
VLNRRKNGDEFPIELWTSVVRDDSGEPLALVGVARDITERKRTEQQITASLREKEALLKEVHHRVKNNLQVISSILSLQAEQATGRDILAILRESQNRIRSMALVHEELYQSEGLSSLDIGDYIRRLGNALLLSYPVGESIITLDVDVGDVHIPVDEAAPCGLIINELVSNALKYAFVGRKRGKLSLSFHRTGNEYALRVADNGVGFPKGLDFRHTDSLGLQLVDALAQQLQGTLTMERRRGTTFTLTFPAATASTT